MPGKAIILGAKGRFGRAAVDAFLAAGWRVRAFVRARASVSGRPNVEFVEGDAFDPEALSTAAKGMDVIVNALNPPYPRWSRDLPRITAAVIAAARASGATVMVPGNVYNYGAGMPERLTEATPHRPTTRKGRLREEMEQAYARAAGEGVRTIILRAGDFIEREKTGNWFDSHIAHEIAKGRVTYPGPLDRVHAWAYLPDMARAMAAIADRHQEFAPFETFGFPGFALTGAELVAAIERAAGRSLKVRTFPWPVIRLMGLVWPLMREIVEMRYLWDVPHAIDGAKLEAALTEFPWTTPDAAIVEALASDVDRHSVNTTTVRAA